MDTEKAVASKPRNFDQMIEVWTKATKQSKELARDIADYALSHAFKHGNITLLNKFLVALETTGKNYVRKSAYLLWLKAYAPVKMEQNVLVVDENKEYDPELLKKALAKPFYDFAPEKQKVFFEADGVVVSITRAINGFDRDNMIPKDDNASKAVELARTTIARLKREIALLEPIIVDAVIEPAQIANSPGPKPVPDEGDEQPVAASAG